MEEKGVGYKSYETLPMKDRGCGKFEAIDLFGQYVTLTHKGEPTFNTLLGAIATVLFGMFIGIFGLRKIIPVLDN
jgi:amino acid transporter